jgi:hypothetical protein
VAYHATPSENVPQIAVEGLLPREGGKNYDSEKESGPRLLRGRVSRGEPIHEADAGVGRRA